jgi:hypothetical protein
VDNFKALLIITVSILWFSTVSVSKECIDCWQYFFCVAMETDGIFYIPPRRSRGSA